MSVGVCAVGMDTNYSLGGLYLNQSIAIDVDMQETGAANAGLGQHVEVPLVHASRETVLLLLVAITVQLAKRTSARFCLPTQGFAQGIQIIIGERL